MTRCVEQNIRILPVLLPGAQEIPSEMLFLRELQWVKFKRSIDEPETLTTANLDNVQLHYLIAGSGRNRIGSD